MSVPAAYLAVIVIWSTTPLAVKWSGEGPGFLFGALGRMAIAAVLCLMLIQLLRLGLPWHKQARRTYAAAALSAYGALICIYWGAQFIPSGMIAVLFGLTPIITGLLANLILREQSFTPGKLAGMALGLTGLVAIFGSGASLGHDAFQGISVVLMGVILHSASSVLVKRTGGSLSGIMVTSGSLLFALPLFFLTWLVFDGAPPRDITDRSLASIVYLGVIGSAVGFTLYFYVLKNIEANQVALITLVAPVFALIIGNVINHEHIDTQVYLGATLVLSGLALHQWAGAWWRRLPLRVKDEE